MYIKESLINKINNYLAYNTLKIYNFPQHQPPTPSTTQHRVLETRPDPLFLVKISEFPGGWQGQWTYLVSLGLVNLPGLLSGDTERTLRPRWHEVTLVQSPAYWLVPLSWCKQLDILRVTWGESRSDRQGEFGWESDPSRVLKNLQQSYTFTAIQ